MRYSRLDSDTHNDIWDAEWWWVSRLDLMMKSRREISNKSRWDLQDLWWELHMSRLDFLCQDLGKFPPVGLTNPRSHATLAKSTITQHIYTHNLWVFHTHSIQITYRLLNQINHSFIFNLIFNNIKSMIFGINWYKQRQNSPFLNYVLSIA